MTQTGLFRRRFFRPGCARNSVKLRPIQGV
jgi:hypothetical protein